MNYEISAGGGTVDIYPRVESFYASMESTLQLRWETYGTNSYYIDAWHVDDVKVDVIPSITNVSIFSNKDISTFSPLNSTACGIEMSSYFFNLST